MRKQIAEHMEERHIVGLGDFEDQVGAVVVDRDRLIDPGHPYHHVDTLEHSKSLAAGAG